MIRRLLCLVATLCVSGSVALAESMSVQVKESPLRSGPSFLGKPVGTVSYGDRVSVLGARAGWSQVQNAAGLKGWLHSSALSKKRIVLKAGAGDVDAGASTDEIALAGKGFSQQVEDEYKSTRKIDFAPVDRMEKRQESRDALFRFVKQGGLGGAK